MQSNAFAATPAFEELAQRHGFSTDAVMHMYDAIRRGNGNMAQFDHEAFGGAGQWMLGGMIMLSDMFNNRLKARVDALCTALLERLASDRRSESAASAGATTTTASASENGTAARSMPSASRDSAAAQATASPAESAWQDGKGQGRWWPADLGRPSSSGAQNDYRYAYFAQRARLAIAVDGHVTVHDTLDHRISGFSQQQGGDGALCCISQHGRIAVSTLPVVGGDGGRPHAGAHHAGDGDAQRILALLQKLADLRAAGMIGKAEFDVKKEALLRRL